MLSPSPQTFVICIAAQRGVPIWRDAKRGCADVVHPAGQAARIWHSLTSSVSEADRIGSLFAGALSKLKLGVFYVVGWKNISRSYYIFVLCCLHPLLSSPSLCSYFSQEWHGYICFIQVKVGLMVRLCLFLWVKVLYISLASSLALYLLLSVNGNSKAGWLESSVIHYLSVYTLRHVT